MAAYRIDYSRVVSQANDIDGLAESLSSEILKLENLLAQVKQEWHGPASTAFQVQLTKLINDMQATKDSMSSVSCTIKDAAKQIQREDEKNAEKD